MNIDILIDSLTDCLVCTATGEECNTEYRLVRRTITKQDAYELYMQGWKFDWSIPQRNGNEGYIQFTAKTELVEHYIKMLNAKCIDWYTLYIDSIGARALIHKYFEEVE